MPKKSPTQRSMDHLRKQGYQVHKVEQWNVFAKRRIDGFGFIDVLAVHPDREVIVGVQTTSADHVAHRRAKILGLAGARAWLRSGGLIEIHGWKVATVSGRRRAVVRVVEITLADFDEKSGGVYDSPTQTQGAEI